MPPLGLSPSLPEPPRIVDGTTVPTLFLHAAIAVLTVVIRLGRLPNEVQAGLRRAAQAQALSRDVALRAYAAEAFDEKS